MRRNLALLFLVGCAQSATPLCPASSPTASTPLSPSGTAPPAGWFMSGGDRADYAASLDPAVPHASAPSIRLAATASNPQGYGTLMRSDDVKPHRGKRMRVSAFVKGQGIERRGDLWVRVQAPDSPGDGPGLGGGTCTLSETFDWKPCEVLFDVADTGTRLEVGIGLAGPGTIWLEGLKVEEVGAVAEPTAPEGWMLSGSHPSDYAAAVDTAVKHGGRGSGSLRSTSKDPAGFATLMQTLVKDSYAGKRVRLSAMVKSDQVAHWAGLWMRVDRANHQMGGFDNMEERPIKGTKDWTRYEVVVDIDPDAMDVAFGALLHGSGQVWMDDVAIEVVGKEVPVTGTHDLPKATKNLDFETAPPSQGAPPAAWVMWGDKWSEYAIAADNTVKHGGSTSGSLRSVAGTPKGFGALTQTIAASDYLGKRVRLSAFLKTDRLTSWAGMWMRVDDVDHPTAAFDNMKDRPLKGTTDWTHCDVVLDVSTAAKDIAFGSVLDGSGQVWMDDATLTVVDRSVPTTGKPKGRDAENLDFEK